jgi:hypothetical protein
MEQLADEPYWGSISMFGKADVRRMRDVEYISVLFVLTMHGIQDGDDLDSYYAKYDSEIPDQEQHLETYRRVEDLAGRLGDTVRQSRFKNRADFYTLWSALLEMAIDGPDVIDFEGTAAALVEFAERVDQVPGSADAQAAGEDAVAYSQAVRAGTTKLPNRMKRMEILLNHIVHK